MKGENMNVWWDLYIGGELLMSIRGKDSAVWFMEQMKVADPLAHWELIPKDTQPKARVITPEAVKMKREVTYCVGSD